MNNKKEGEYYSQMVRRYKNEYGGENLQEFCIKEKVSYTKMLHCLRNESYRKPQSYFLGSVKSAKRFARLVSLTQSAKNCKRNVQKYFHDILNRVVVTVKDELVGILPHKWVEPVTIPLVY